MVLSELSFCSYPGSGLAPSIFLMELQKNAALARRQTAATQPNSQPVLKWLCSEFVEKNCHLSYVEEDIVLASIRYIGGKVLSHHAVPVG